MENKYCERIYSILTTSKFIAKILSHLDYDSLRHAQHVCKAWKTVVKQEKLWENLYDRNLQKLEWRKMKKILNLRSLHVFPSEESKTFHEEACCLIGDYIEKLEKNWKYGTYIHTSFYLNQSPTKPNNNNNNFYMDERWILKALTGGRISVRNRWAPEAEHMAELIPNKKVPFDNLDQHPIIESVQCNEDFLIAIGRVDTRKILFVFQIKRFSEPPLLRLTAWRIIENTEAKMVYTFDSKNCIFLRGDSLLLCGKKVTDDLATVVTLMNPREMTTSYKNLEIPKRIGLLCDVRMDNKHIVLFFGTSENPRLKRIDRYRIHIRELETFSFLGSFVLPIVHSPVCYFDYSNGFAITGSDDSPIRIWNVSAGTCDGDFSHESHLSAIRIVADRIILTCNQQGVIKIWSMHAALNPSTRDHPESVLLKKLDQPKPPYWSFRSVKVLAMQADEFQIALVLQYDSKSPQLYIMDFLADEESIEKNESEKNARKNRKRRKI